MKVRFLEPPLHHFPFALALQPDSQLSLLVVPFMPVIYTSPSMTVPFTWAFGVLLLIFYRCNRRDYFRFQDVKTSNVIIDNDFHKQICLYIPVFIVGVQRERGRRSRRVSCVMAPIVPFWATRDQAQAPTSHSFSLIHFPSFSLLYFRFPFPITSRALLSLPHTFSNL